MSKIALFAFSLLSLAGGASAQSDYQNSAGAMYRALAEQPHEMLSIGGGEIDVVFADGAPGLDRAPVLAWIRKSAEAATAYFGKFPVAKAGLLVIAGDGARIGGGTAFGFGGPAIRIMVGRGAGADAFDHDWKLTHEMVHLALPVVMPMENAAWMMEGSATYIEPLARAMVGQLSEQSVWSDTLDGMPKGQPKPGDGGLDQRPDWGRTYWGGAAFWLLADVTLREKTAGRFGLIDALRGVNRESGGNGAEWSERRVMEAGDKATGTHVLTDLYDHMKDEPVAVDLDGLFARLGVTRRDGQVTFDERAPLAAIRRALTVKP